MSNRDYNIILGILVTVACIIAAILFYVVYRGSQGVDPTPTPVPETATPSLPDDAWQRIQTTGILRAGTSADYPPFAFRTSEFTLDGLDIAVINEIGRRLGVTVELADMAFEGLSWALELEQVDVAIAAISITPERSERINFSEVYFVSEDATLARVDADIQQLLSVEEMAPFRIGVERSTVYSNWLHETLVDPGLMVPSQLVEYEDISFAVRDLREGRIDLVVLDLQPAQVAESQGGVEIVVQGLNTQYFGIGLPKEEPTLQAQINSVLASMKADGTLAALIEEYTGTAPPPFPTITPTSPAATPTTAPGVTSTPVPCVDGMTFVEDVNLDDNNMTTPPVLKPGQPFRKGWRIKNTGTCTWNQFYKLTYDGGNSPASSMGGQPTPIQGQVPPGAVYDIYADLVAPFKPGVYQGFWVLRNQQDQKFGSRLWVGIEVPAPPTLTPPPTQTPAPGIVFNVDRTQINAGDCVTFRWSVSNARSQYFYQLGQPWQQYPVAPQGSSLECPSVSTTYELRVVKNDGSVEIRQLTIYVQPKPGAPIIERFTVDPPVQIVLGQAVNITWQVSGNVDKVRLLRGDVVLWDNAPLSSTMQDRPPNVGQVTYIIEASGQGGLSRSTQSINVTTPPPPTNTPIVSPTVPVVTETPTPIPPVIISFTLNPAQIQTGDCTIVSWDVSGDVARIQISRNGDVLLDNAPFSGSQQDCLLVGGSYAYRLDVLGQNGQSEFSEQTLTVIDAPTVPPLEGTSWTLDGISDGAGNMVVPIQDTIITAIFAVDGNLSGESGCNPYATTYTVDGSSINIGATSGGTVFCDQPAGVMDQEQRYLTLLPQAASFDLSSGSLLINDANGRQILQYISRER
jgi:ABC-type amino acid transport substrate-binding protein/heat shock protein HslJ